MKTKKIVIDNCLKIYRRATPADVAKWNLAKEMELDTMYKARVLAKELGLSMKLTDVDYQGDKSKATFYYTAEGRVDYRELIKHLSKAFHIRVEMRQIGIREEACRIGGMGPAEAICAAKPALLILKLIPLLRPVIKILPGDKAINLNATSTMVRRIKMALNRVI